MAAVCYWSANRRASSFGLVIRGWSLGSHNGVASLANDSSGHDAKMVRIPYSCLRSFSRSLCALLVVWRWLCFSTIDTGGRCPSVEFFVARQASRSLWECSPEARLRQRCGGRRATDGEVRKVMVPGGCCGRVGLPGLGDVGLQ